MSFLTYPATLVSEVLWDEAPRSWISLKSDDRFRQGHLLPAAIAEHVAVVPQHLLNAYEWPQGEMKIDSLQEVMQVFLVKPR